MALLTGFSRSESGHRRTPRVRRSGPATSLPKPGGLTAEARSIRISVPSMIVGEGNQGAADALVTRNRDRAPHEQGGS